MTSCWSSCCEQRADFSPRCLRLIGEAGERLLGYLVVPERKEEDGDGTNVQDQHEHEAEDRRSSRRDLGLPSVR
jgi:hypothetical protein